MNSPLIEISYTTNIHEKKIEAKPQLEIVNEGIPYIHFKKNIEILKKQLKSYDSLNSIDSDSANFTLRGTIALVFSSVDHFFREILKNCVNQILSGEKNPTSKFNEIQIDLSLSMILNSINKDLSEWSELIINAINSRRHRSILSPTKSISNVYAIKNTLKILSNNSIFEEVEVLMNTDTTTIEKQMIKFYERRNSIVHRMDYSDKLQSEHPISKPEVIEIIIFYEKFISHINNKLKID